MRLNFGSMIWGHHSGPCKIIIVINISDKQLDVHYYNVNRRKLTSEDKQIITVLEANVEKQSVLLQRF